MSDALAMVSIEGPSVSTLDVTDVVVVEVLRTCRGDRSDVRLAGSNLVETGSSVCKGERCSSGECYDSDCRPERGRRVHARLLWTLSA